MKNHLHVPSIPLAQWLLFIAALCSALVPWGVAYLPMMRGDPEVDYIAGWKIPEFRLLATMLIAGFWLSSIERQNRTDGRFFHCAFFLVNLAVCIFLIYKTPGNNNNFGWRVPIVGTYLFLLFSSLHYAAAAMLSPKRTA